MSLYKNYKTDSSLEEEGVRIDFGDGVFVTIRRATSKVSREAYTRLMKPYSNGFRKGSLPADVIEDISLRHVAEGLIVTWEGVTGPDGKALEPTIENKVQVLRDLPDFRSDVESVSVEADAYREEFNAETVKN